MAHDLFFRKPTKRSWSRDPQAATPGHAEKVEASKVSIQQQKLIALKTAADKGDKKAQKKWSKISKKVVKLHLKASKGDLKAAKTLAMLTPTGLFVTTVGPKTLKTSMKGSFVGKDEILGAFVGGDSVTEILGDDKLTEIITSGGAFVGDDKLTEIITSGNDSSPKKQSISVKAFGGLAQALRENTRQRDVKAVEHDKSLPIDKKIDTSLLGNAALTEIITSGKFIGEEESALAAEGGACERAALRRRSVRKA